MFYHSENVKTTAEVQLLSYKGINKWLLILKTDNNLYIFRQLTKQFFKVVLLKIEHRAAIRHP